MAAGLTGVGLPAGRFDLGPTGSRASRPEDSTAAEAWTRDGFVAGTGVKSPAAGDNFLTGVCATVSAWTGLGTDVEAEVASA